MFVLVLKYDWLLALTDLVGTALPRTTLFIGGLVFLVLIAVQFSIKLSTFSDQLKSLGVNINTKNNGGSISQFAFNAWIAAAHICSIEYIIMN